MRSRPYPGLSPLFVALLATAVPAQERAPAAGLVALHQACLDASTDAVVLNIAAHPDDESSRTNVILRRNQGVRVVTAYSTYGDGGQNAVGKEIGRDLAPLRVRETLQAAAISDIEVRWLGMQDFGFSKTLDETLRVWGADQLKDAMRAVVDELEPDFIITNHTLDRGHGHHRASYWAIVEVLKERAAQGRRVPPLYVRCGADEAQISLDPFELDPVRGETYARMAYRAWIQHETQGPWSPHNPLQEGKDHWQLVFPEGASKEQAVAWWHQKDAEARRGAAALEAAPQAAAAALQQAMAEPAGSTPIQRDRRAHRIAALQRVLMAQHGVELETWLDQDEVAVGGSGRIFIVVHGVEKVRDLQLRCGDAVAEPVPEELRRSPFQRAATPPAGAGTAGNAAVDAGKPAVPPPSPEDRFQVAFACASPAVGDDPEPSHAILSARFTLAGMPMALDLRLPYTAVGPVEVAWDRDVVMVPKGRRVERIVSATVTRHRDADVDEPVRLGCPAGIQAEAIPARLELTSEHPEARLLVRATFDGEAIAEPTQLQLEVAGQRAALVVMPVEVFVPPGLKVGLVRGPDDTIERALADLGVAYTALDRDALAVARLEDFSTLLLDMRAYHHRPELAEYRDRLLQFCRAGGRIVSMYHKEREWNERPGHPLLSPFPLTVGADRITEEDSPVTMLLPEHRLWHQPHQITAADFAGWVQERGLNFPSKWDPAWAPLLQLQDSGDAEPLLGALLYTRYGRGDFVYCSLVLYRQLRQGHAGAARLLVNLLSR